MLRRTLRSINWLSDKVLLDWVRSTDEVAKREFGGLAKLGRPTTEPISGRVLALLFSFPHNIILSFFILCKLHFCKHCFTDISLIRKTPELPTIFFLTLSKLHNAYNTRKAVEDHVFAALDHEGILKISPHFYKKQYLITFQVHATSSSIIQPRPRRRPRNPLPQTPTSIHRTSNNTPTSLRPGRRQRRSRRRRTAPSRRNCASSR